MKRFIAGLLILTSTLAFGADKKITDLTLLPAASFATGDTLPIVDVSANETKKTTIGDFDLRYQVLGNYLTGLSGDVSASGPGIGAATISGLSRSKLANGTANYVLINNGSGVMSQEAQLAVSRGGTGLASGTSGGILGFTGTGVLASSALLPQYGVMIGGGAGATPTGLSDIGTTTKVLHGNASGSPTWSAVSLTADVTGTLPIANGGTGQATKAPAFDALSPLSALGDTLYGGASGTGTALAGNITSTKKFLSQTGTGTVSAAPAWAQPTCSDISGAAASCATDATNATNISAGTLAVARGGTGLGSGTSGGVLAFTASGTLTSSAALTANQLVIGGGAGVVPSSLAAGTQYQVLRMGAANPAYGSINLDQSAAVTGNLPIGNGGTGQATKAAAFDALSPMSLLGDLIYGGASGTGTALAGNTTTTKKFLSQTGNGSVSAAPSWAQPAFSDISGTASLTTQVTGTLPVGNGGTGQASYTDGQLLIGNSSTGLLSKATLSAGSNITITNGNGSISIAASSSATPAFTYTSQTSNYTAAVGDWVVASSTAFAITLPTAASQSGKIIWVEHEGAQGVKYTIKTTSSQTISLGGTTYSNTDINTNSLFAMYTTGETIEFKSDGSNWRATSHYAKTTPSACVATTLTASGSAPVKGTMGVDCIYWERDGRYAIIYINFQQTGAGTANSGTYGYRVTLPGSLTADTTYAEVNTSTNSTQAWGIGALDGTIRGNLGTSGGFIGTAVMYDSTTFRMSGDIGSGGYGIWGLSNTLANTTVTMVGKFRVPISGWLP